MSEEDQNLKQDENDANSEDAQDEQNQVDEKHDLLLLQRELELIERDCEQLRRENALLQSWLQRKKQDMDASLLADEAEAEQEYKTILSYNVKQEIATEELEFLQKDIEDGRARSEAMIDELQAIIQHTKWNIAEIKKEYSDQKRVILRDAVDPRDPNKFVADKVARFMINKFKQMEQKAQKLEAKNKMLAEQIARQEDQLKQKKTSEELKQIDLNQLLIQNKKLVKEIDSKNKLVKEFKRAATRTLSRLNEVKRDLEAVTRENNKMKADMETLEKIKPVLNNTFVNNQNKLKSLQGEQENIQREKEKASKEKKIVNVDDLISLKTLEDENRLRISNVMRKIMISSMMAKKERKKLKDKNIKIDQDLDGILKKYDDFESDRKNKSGSN